MTMQTAINVLAALSQFETSLLYEQPYGRPVERKEIDDLFNVITELYHHYQGEAVFKLCADEVADDIKILTYHYQREFELRKNGHV